MTKKPLDPISTLEKEEQVELDTMNIVFGKDKQKKKVKDGLHILQDPKTGATIIKEYYKNGMREGLLEFFWENGQICMTGEYLKDKREGLHESFYENGNTWSIGEFIKDKPVGLHKLFHENGTIHQEAFYKNGKLHGKVFSYLDSGELEWMNEYLNGEEV